MLKTYTGQPVKLRGRATVTVEHNGCRTELPLHIVDDQGTAMPTLLGRDWLEKLQLDWNTVSAVTQSTDFSFLREKFPEVFRTTPGIVRKFEAKIAMT